MATVDGLARSSQALAIAGIDDVTVGGLLLVMLTLGGYAVSSAVSDATLQILGASFTDWANGSDNQSLAVARAMAAVAQYQLDVRQEQVEASVQRIATGAGDFAAWMADAAETGRLTIDGWLGGAGANQAALWGLVSEWRNAVVQAFPTATVDSTMAGKAGQRIYDYFGTVRVAELGELSQLMDYTFPDGTVWAMTLSGYVGAEDERYVFYGTDSRYYPYFTYRNSGQAYPILLQCQGGGYYVRRTSSWKQPYALGSGFVLYNNPAGDYYKGYPIVTPSVLSGGVLPGVDKAADCPETLGAGYDFTPIGADAVINGADEVVHSGTIALPVQLPGVDVPYVQGLYGLDAGVVPGVVSVPYGAGVTDVYVGTPSGVVSMPVSQAVAADTSIGVTAEPSVPVVPPGTPDVGPWQPGYNLPFQDVWPFNMIYDYVSILSQLGGE